MFWNHRGAESLTARDVAELLFDKRLYLDSIVKRKDRGAILCWRIGGGPLSIEVRRSANYQRSVESDVKYSFSVRHTDKFTWHSCESTEDEKSKELWRWLSVEAERQQLAESVDMENEAVKSLLVVMSSLIIR